MTCRDLADGEVKEKDEILTGIDQKMVNQKDPSQMVIEVMLLEMIEVNKDTLDVTKRDILKGIVWQKTSICIMRKRTMKILT